MSMKKRRKTIPTCPSPRPACAQVRHSETVAFREQTQTLIKLLPVTLFLPGIIRVFFLLLFAGTNDSEDDSNRCPASPVRSTNLMLIAPSLAQRSAGFSKV